MMAARMICLVMFLWNMILFTQAIRCLFVRPEGMPSLMRVLSIVGLVGLFTDAVLLARVADVHLWQIITGLALLVLSQWLYRAALAAMREVPLSLAFSRDAPAFLLQRGPYRRVRHPFYTAYALSWLAVAVLTAHSMAAAVLLIMSTLYISAALQEERKFLRSTLATDYRTYRQRTGMFLPLLINPSNNIQPTP